MTDAERDQDHIEMLIHSKPQIPDRTDYILGRSTASPLPDILDMGNALAKMGADYIAIPCITAHYFQEELSHGIKVPIINIVKETAGYLKNCGIAGAGIMATEGTIYSEIFQKELKSLGIMPVVPSKKQQENISYLIYNCIKANRPVSMEKFREAAGELKRDGAQVIILGCTELSIIKRENDIGSGFIDAMEVLAIRCIQLCGARLKNEYSRLIT